MKITMKSYEGKEVEFEIDEGDELFVSDMLDVLGRYFVGCCRSGDREILKSWGVYDNIEEEEND